MPKHYVSFKSILNFAATVHICIGILFWFLLIALLDTINDLAPKYNISAPLMGLEYFVYFFLFLPMGYLIYRGVKKESVPLLQYTSIGFGVLQIYGIIIQSQFGILLSTFIVATFAEAEIEQDFLVELSVDSSVTLIYVIAIFFYINQLKSHFYIPPVYPCRVEYFYYPQDTSSNVTVFHKQVPFKIMENYQNSAYIVQERRAEDRAKSSKWRLNSIMNGGVRKYRNS